MNKRQLEILEELLNNEIEECLDSGFGLDNDYVIELRQFIKEFNLKEYWNYDIKYGSDKNGRKEQITTNRRNSTSK